jgi:uracil permease
VYGVIGASGIRVLIESKVDYSKAQNLILTSVILITGTGMIWIAAASLPTQESRIAMIAAPPITQVL